MFFSKRTGRRSDNGSLDEESKNLYSVEASPNPAKDFVIFRVESSDENLESRLEVRDMNGRLFFTEEGIIGTENIRWNSEHLSAAYGQQGFIKAYDFSLSGTYFSNMLIEEDTVIICGLAVDTIAPYQQGILFAKLDTLGELIGTKMHYDSTGNHYGFGGEPGGLLKVADGSGYIVLGGIFGTNNGIILKLDTEGELMWVKEYPDANSLVDFYKKIIEVEDGFLITGSKQKLSFQGDIFLMKTDKEGNKLWEQTYGLTSRNDQVDNLLKINNNEYILGGNTGPNQGTPWEQWHKKLQIFAVDSLGNEKWYWESNPDFDQWTLEDIKMVGLHKDDGGNWVYATQRGEFQVNGALGQQAKFVKRDNNFNLITESVYDDVDSDRNGFLNMIPLSDGDYLAMGNNYELVEEPVNSISHVYGWMVRVSSEGDSLWMRNDLTFPDTASFTKQYLHSAVELPSGNIIAAGYFEGSGYTDHGLLIKVNQHGCLDFTNCTPTNITYVNTPNHNPDLKVYPNPTRHLLRYESEEIPIWDKVELLDINGQVMKEVRNNKMLSMEGYAPGVYILRLWKDGRFWTRKVVRQ